MMHPHFLNQCIAFVRNPSTRLALAQALDNKLSYSGVGYVWGTRNVTGEGVGGVS